MSSNNTSLGDISFYTSATSVENCPEATLPEFAFIGRSNVGKSSLINLLTGINNLAHISSKPGKTRLLNFYNFSNLLYLVDLPGYGFAKTSKQNREEWLTASKEYFKKRKTLACVVVLIDISIPPQKIDDDFIEWLGINEIPFVLAYTKADKLTPAALKKQLEVHENNLEKSWAELPPYFTTSVKGKRGKEEILSFLMSTAKDYHQLIIESGLSD
jgi:GTP-binding protein